MKVNDNSEESNYMIKQNFTQRFSRKTSQAC